MSHNVREKREKNIQHLSLHPDPHQKVMGSLLGRDRSPIRVLCKSVQLFLCDPADELTNHLTNKQVNGGDDQT